MAAERSDPPAEGKGRQSPLEGRLLAEALRAWEEAEGPVDDAEACDAARAVDGDFERRVIERARRVPIAGKLSGAIGGVLRSGRLVMAAGAAAMLLVGAGAAWGAMEGGPPGAVNVFWTLIVLLGVQTLMLVLWLVLVFAARGATGSAGWVGEAVARAWRRVTSWVHRGREQAAAVEAAGGVLGSGALGRWTLSAITHGGWAAFNVGCVMTLVVMLSVRYYAFTWETTILPGEAFAHLTQLVASGPRALGLPTPTPEQVAATQTPADPEGLAEARVAWAGLLLGSLVVYGLLPRLGLLAACWAAARWAAGRYRLDTSRSGYLRLRDRLEPRARRIGIRDADEAGGRGGSALAEPADIQPPAPPRRPLGPPAILGLEIGPPDGAWPPPVDAVAWRNLGFVDDRDDRRRVLRELTEGAEEPSAAVVVCELPATPDRGAAAFLREVRRALTRPPALLLTAGQKLRKRGDSGKVERRVHQWRELARAAGLEPDRVIELDLDHATDTSLEGLARLVRAGGNGAPVAAAEPEGRAAAGGRRIDQAFGRIVEHCRRWGAPPDEAAQVRLHREIAALYRAEQRRSWAAMLRVPESLEGDWLANAKAGASRMVGLLPDRLRGVPRWAVAGATAGALGCVAAAMLVAPAALVTLPSWSVIGGAIGAIARAARSDRAAEAEAPAAEASDFTIAVDAAALFTLLLELQGRGEAAITRILDRTLPVEHEPPHIGSAEDARAYLDQLRRRFGSALASEQPPHEP